MWVAVASHLLCSFIRRVEVEGAFHIGDGGVRVVLLVEVDEGEVAPRGGELLVQTGSRFPCLQGQVVLTLVVVEVAQVIGGTGILRVGLHGMAQGEDGFQTVGEAIVRAGFDGAGLMTWL